MRSIMASIFEKSTTSFRLLSSAIRNQDSQLAVAQYKALYDLSPPESINYTWFDAGTRMSQGDIGMFFWWSAYFTLINANGYMTGEPSVIKGDFGIVPCPVDGDTPPATSLGGWSHRGSMSWCGSASTSSAIARATTT